jgi:hypothetical protein
MPTSSKRLLEVVGALTTVGIYWGRQGPVKEEDKTQKMSL